MFEMEIDNPLDKDIKEDSLFDFKMIKLKFKKNFYGEDREKTDRARMKIEELDIEYQNWMNTFLTMDNGLMEFTIPRSGIYRIIQQSRSTNMDVTEHRTMSGPAMGVTITLELRMKKVFQYK